MSLFDTETWYVRFSSVTLHLWSTKEAYSISFIVDNYQSKTTEEQQRPVPDPSVLSTADLSNVRCISDGPHSYTNTIRLQGKYLPKNGAFLNINVFFIKRIMRKHGWSVKSLTRCIYLLRNSECSFGVQDIWFNSKLGRS